jgi:hypothetical protein
MVPKSSIHVLGKFPDCNSCRDETGFPAVWLRLFLRKYVICNFPAENFYIEAVCLPCRKRMARATTTAQIGGLMTDQRTHLYELLENAVRGDEQSISDVCEFIYKHRKQETVNRLLKAGVAAWLDEAWQEVLLTVRQTVSQLRIVDAFEPWLWRLEMSVARKYRARYARYNKAVQVELQNSEQSREIGVKTIQLNGKTEIARLFEPHVPQEQPTRRPLFEPVTDMSLAKASTSNLPNYLTLRFSSY